MSNSPFSFLRRKRVFARSAVRHACQIDCELFLTDSEMSFDGRLTDISVGGAQFRPRLAYLMSRRNEPVELRVGSIAIRGELLTTRRRVRHTLRSGDGREAAAGIAHPGRRARARGGVSAASSDFRFSGPVG